MTDRIECPFCHGFGNIRRQLVDGSASDWEDETKIPCTACHARGSEAAGCLQGKMLAAAAGVLRNWELGAKKQSRVESAVAKLTPEEILALGINPREAWRAK